MTTAAQTTPEVPPARRNRVAGPKTRNSARSDYAALAEYGIKHADALRAVRERRRELEGRLGAMDEFLAMSEPEYTALTDGAGDLQGVEKLREIRGWFSGELEVACRVLGLDSYEAGERAAISEFDGGYSRRQAEVMALRDLLQQCGRYDGNVKELVEGGAILDVARRYLDDMAALRLARESAPGKGAL